MGGKKIVESYMGGSIFGPRFTWVVKFSFLSGTCVGGVLIRNHDNKLIFDFKHIFELIKHLGTFQYSGALSRENTTVERLVSSLVCRSYSIGFITSRDYLSRSSESYVSEECRITLSVPSTAQLHNIQHL